MRIIELFAGIGACSKALENLGYNVEIVDAVEIDKYAIKSFNAIHSTNFEPQDITKWNKNFENIDLITHGSPCQDFSLAGKQAGGDKDSGTRSSLMWETVRIIENIKPKYVIWENVKNLLSKAHKHNFDNYIETMDNLGYNSYYQVLNAKDYGVPQNRERVYTISIRKDIDKGTFNFPEKEELKIRLKDVLEENVDGKYYLSNVQLESIKNSSYIQNQRRIQEKEYCDTLCARDWKDPKCVRIGGIFDTENSKHQAGSIYDKEGLSPTLDIMQGGWRQPSIFEEQKIITNKALSETLEKNEIKKDVNFIDSYNRNIREDDLAGTITTRVSASNNTFIGIKNEPKIISNEITQQEEKIIENNNYIKIKNNTKRGYLEAYPGDGVYTNVSNKRGTVQKDMIQTLTSFQDKGVVMSNLRIRKLTPKECWRLMGFDDESFEKAANVPTSNSQLYKQAGNSIVVKVLEKIFKNLLEV